MRPTHICADCGRQFIDNYSRRGYSQDVKEICLKMYCNGMGFRQIDVRMLVITRSSIGLNKQPSNYRNHRPLKLFRLVRELDELPTFVGSKKT